MLKSKSTQNSKDEKLSLSQRSPVSAITLKFSVLSLILIMSILYSDYTGLFNPDNKNNHTLKKWDSFYNFNRQDTTDILLVGNSHLYTGINPKNLSSALGCNAFILASPGTNVIDHYFSLEEAIKISKPKIVVIETYGLKKTDQYNLTKRGLSDQFKSFSARRNLTSKILATPKLFSVKDYHFAWSNTIRNHNYLYTNLQQIKDNQKNLKKISFRKNRYKRNKELYLGRFVRFQTGIEKPILEKYKNQGAPVKGLEFETNKKLDNYISKIISLCETNNIELIFLTLPMYKEHISDYSYWKEKLKSSIGIKYSNNSSWIDLQADQGYKGFSTHSFENTYKTNQHMTYNGSLLATYKLVDFIQEKTNLPNRRKNQQWRHLFYGEEGFFENNSPDKSDNTNIILYNSKNEDAVKELLLLKRGKYNTLIAKVMPSSKQKYNDYIIKKVRITALIKTKVGKQENLYIDLLWDSLHSSNKKINYSINIQSFEILKINSVDIVHADS